MGLGDQIRIRLKASGMAQNELARRAGLSSSGMSTIINGAYDPRLSSLRMIAAELHCTVGDLLEETQQEAKINTPEELRLLAIVQQLYSQGVTKVIDYAADLAENEKYREEASAASSAG